MMAAKSGHAAAVASLLSAGANVDKKAIGGHSALAKAARRGNAQIVAQLLSNGAYIGAGELAAAREGAKCGLLPPTLLDALAL